MSETFPIQKTKRTIGKQSTLGIITPKRDSYISSDDGTASNSTESQLEPSAPVGPTLIKVEFRLGLESEDLKEKDLIVLKRPSDKVTIVRHAAAGLVMARKIVSVEGSSSVRKNILRELRIMHDCHSENIIEFYAAFEDDKQRIVMCTEHMDVGSLYDIIKLGPIRVDVVGKFSLAILTGLDYLYVNHRIMHRDIQPSNVIINSRGHIKLFNFGVSSELMNSIADTFVGSVGYMAPERIQQAPYTIKSDIWAVGLTIIEAATSCFPFFAQDSNNQKHYPLSTLDLLQHIVYEPAPKLPQSDAFPTVLHQFVEKCLMKDPEDRPRPGDLLIRDEFILAAKRTPVDLLGYFTEVMEDPKFSAPSYLAESVENKKIDVLEAYSYEVRDTTNKTMLSLLTHLNNMISIKDFPHTLESDSLFICERCKQILGALKTHGLEKNSVDDGAQKGCNLCQLILDCLPKVNSKGTSDPFNKTFLQPTPKVKNRTRAVLKVGRQSRLMYEVMRIGAKYEDLTTGSHCAYQMGGTWLHNCITTHNKCVKANDLSLPLLPSRVLDISPNTDSKSVRLHTGAGQTGIYFTLSYRWNQTAPTSFQTTMSNEAQYRNEIRIETLPSVMQDAISITRRFGVQYLWIDALCIVQDSPEDWEKGAKEMAAIYKNSLLTIAAATDGKDTTQGCFRIRNRLQPRPLLAPTPYPGGDNKYVFADRRMTKDGVRPPSELDTRAWVLQEQILSPRVLTYSNQEIYWDCKTLNASETFPNGIPAFYDTDLQLPDERLFKEAINNTANTQVSQSRLYISWMKIVEAYSERQMTKETDKLVALLGVVKEASFMFDDAFVVGLWRKRLVPDLLWWVKSPDKSKRPIEFSAPSWSWLSWNAAISYNLGGFDTVDNINHCIKASVEAESNPTMPHLSGELKVEGKLFPLRSEVQANTPRLPDQTLALSWMEDIEGTDASQVTCLIVAVSKHYIYALGLLLIQGDRYKRAGLVHWRNNPENVGWDCANRKWQPSVEKGELRTIVIV